MITIKDIAAKCGVSVSTVSRVLNNQPYVKDEVRSKVLKVIEEEHFVPHEGAVSLAKTPENAIGIVVRGMGNIFFSEMFPIIESRIQEMGYVPVIHQIPAKEDELSAAASLAKSRKLKGIILLGGRFDYSESSIEKIDVPCVCCTFKNTFSEFDNDNLSSICIDDKAEAIKTVSYLYENGHKKIAIVLPSVSDHSISEIRFHGYVEGFKKYGMKVDPNMVIETKSFDMEQTYAVVKEYITNGGDATAFFAVSDTMGLAVIKALAECGKSVPKDASVMAIDGIDITRYTMPTLTTLVQPKAEIAIKAVEMLNGMINGEFDTVHKTVETTLREGGSVRTI